MIAAVHVLFPDGRVGGVWTPAGSAYQPGYPAAQYEADQDMGARPDGTSFEDHAEELAGQGQGANGWWDTADAQDGEDPQQVLDRLTA